MKAPQAAPKLSDFHYNMCLLILSGVASLLLNNKRVPIEKEILL